MINAAILGMRNLNEHTSANKSVVSIIEEMGSMYIILYLVWIR